MNLHYFFLWPCFCLLLLQTLCKFALVAHGLGCNWGTRATHPLPPDTVVQLLKDNGFNKVKLFEAEPEALKALGNSGIQVMLGIPNEFLAPLSSSVRVAEDWVQQNVSSYVSKYGVDIRYVAVGNEPFLSSYKNTYQDITFPALKNIQAALIKAGLARQVKVTVPFNADVYQSQSNLPSGGDFRSDIHSLMVSIIKFLSDNGCPLAINIYPFLSLYADPNFPFDFAFFPNNTTTSASIPLVDGSITYTNVFEANYDTLIWALEKNGFPSMPVIIGEVGWPTDGHPKANLDNARRFNQGLVDRIVQGRGTPKRPSPAPDVYLFGLIDEDAKSIQPGNFERHWGIFYYDGTVKYKLDLGHGKSLVPAKGVKYLARQWCVMSPGASSVDPNLVPSINYACTYADCTSLGYGSSCGGLDARSNASYAFNIYYQTANQQKGACQFNNLSAITTVDPSQDTCRFEIMIDIGKHERPKNQSPTTTSSSSAATIDHLLQNRLLILFFFIIVFSVMT
ncbi:glucan endo-1,3-beta-glucosidase 5-like [Telopea speciosissima]|uniref:glucan endo-1,3-beta-glucosidase 5-like n=1 Tax=Telopea speciosissima TaxID=54955 RepID=UPI001CC344E0|nr:glucan endo-1,3-beta-glucosidase 5-like [Telopea speciosissima]